MQPHPMAIFSIVGPLLGLLPSVRAPAQVVLPAVLEAEEVAKLLVADGPIETRLLLIDVRSGPGHDGRYITGSVSLDVTEWARLAKAAGEGLGSAEAWRRRIAGLGISDGRPVAVMDNGSMTEAARVWFLLQHFGVRQASVVNGGYKALAGLLPTERLTTELAPPPSEKAANPAATEPAAVVGLVEKSSLKQRLGNKDMLVLDVRTENEYLGKDARGNPRPGHLPDAVNLPHAGLLDERGRLKPAEALRAIFDEVGLKPGVKAVMHCQSGGRSSLAALAAVHAGITGVENYYLSFGEWSADGACPVVRTGTGE